MLLLARGPERALASVTRVADIEQIAVFIGKPIELLSRPVVIDAETIQTSQPVGRSTVDARPFELRSEIRLIAPVVVIARGG